MSDRLYTLTVRFEDDGEYEAAVAYAVAHLFAWPGAACAYVAHEMTIIVTGDRQAMTEPIKALAQHIAEEAWEGSLALTQKLLTPAEEAARDAERLLRRTSQQ
ncbi:hypothetical protein ACIP4U_36560 [Streptomyces caelestis]|uniref:hypothetical protein n=1 Tax=Streptomyces caelestis TaxID=36816 RepID=UPI00382A7961